MIDYNHMSDEDLYEMCHKGDNGAWQYLRECFLQISRNRRWKLNDPEEIASKVVLKLLDGGLNKVDDKGKFRNFVTTMTCNLIKDHYKKGAIIVRGKKIPLIDDKEMPASSKPPRGKVDIPLEDFAGKGQEGENVLEWLWGKEPEQLKNILTMESKVKLEAAINKLSPKERRIFKEYLNYQDGGYKDYAELSKALDVDNSTITRNVNKCMETLREMPELQTYFGTMQAESAADIKDSQQQCKQERRAQ